MKAQLVYCDDPASYWLYSRGRCWNDFLIERKSIIILSWRIDVKGKPSRFVSQTNVILEASILWVWKQSRSVDLKLQTMFFNPRNGKTNAYFDKWFLEMNLSPVQTLATLLANKMQHCWAQHVASVCTPCCVLLEVVDRPNDRNIVGRNMLRAFGHAVATCSSMIISNLSQQHPTCRNTSQHIATRWPNAHNMLRPTMLRYVDMLRPIILR